VVQTEPLSLNQQGFGPKPVSDIPQRTPGGVYAEGGNQKTGDSNQLKPGAKQELMKENKQEGDIRV